MKLTLACKAVLRQNSDTMKILALSDQVEERIYSLAGQGHFREVGLVLGCGDLPYAYLEYLVSALNVPMFYVPGNHDPQENPRLVSTRAEGSSDLDLKLAARQRTFACRLWRFDPLSSRWSQSIFPGGGFSAHHSVNARPVVESNSLWPRT